MRARFFLVILCGLLGLTVCWPAAVALAQPVRGSIQPLDRLLPGIRRAHPGNLYDAEGPTYGPLGDPHYHLKWMTPDGRVIWYDADARTGRVLRMSRGRDMFDGPRAPGVGRYGRPYPYPYARRFVLPPGYVRPYGRLPDDDRWRH